MATNSLKQTHSTTGRHSLLVDQDTRRVPLIVHHLNAWQYLEYSLYRLLCARGREIGDWHDKSFVHKTIWEQTEIVAGLRARIAQFPGGDPDAPVPAVLEDLVETILTAPDLDHFLEGVFGILLRSQVKAYAAHATGAHPIHDAPTIQLLHRINAYKDEQFRWYRAYRRRHPVTLDEAWTTSLTRQIDGLDGLAGIPKARRDHRAGPVGLRCGFRPVAEPARETGTMKADFTPYLRSDFDQSIEARRLFWAWGYMREKNIPDRMLLWMYDGHFMPFDWHHDVARHMWDESRHGDSGYSRLQDWGIGIDEVGFFPYEDGQDTSDPASGRAPVMEPKDIYEAAFDIGLIAETGHFVVKNEAYEDFREAGDFESAEMMLFDIIDEHAHVQYAHKWLPVLAEHAGIDCTGYKDRAAEIRKDLQAKADEQLQTWRELPRDDSQPGWLFYQELLERIGKATPLNGHEPRRKRHTLPM
ncbi:MAG: hypothetical protein ACFE0O_06585 [Opitutales bacterium]